jgi:hypothetical protein
MLIFLWLVFAVAVGVAANSRGRNPVGWFFISIFLSPLVRAFLLFAMPADQAEGSFMDRWEGRVTVRRLPLLCRARQTKCEGLQALRP